MQLYSPQTKHTNLGSSRAASGSKNNNTNEGNDKALLELLNQRVLIATNGVKNKNSTLGDGSSSIGIGIRNSNSELDHMDTILDEHLIPSPPMSPKFSTIHRDEDNSDILLKPIWQPGLTVKRYRHATHGFLSQYKIFDDSIINRRQGGYYNTSNRSRRYNYSDVRKYPYIHDDDLLGGRHKRPSRRAGRPSHYDDGKYVSSVYGTDDTDWDSYNPILSKRPSTPIHRIKKSTPAVSSPLASALAIHSAPQYVPNMSWEKLPDYSPPLSTLPADNTKSLKVEWKGSSMDLSHDPLKKHLHPAELQLASILRLPCDLYLDSKRRLFLEKVHRLKKGLPFRRTDAQKACRIDVNLSLIHI